MKQTKAIGFDVESTTALLYLKQSSEHGFNLSKFVRSTVINEACKKGFERYPHGVSVNQRICFDIPAHNDETIDALTHLIYKGEGDISAVCCDAIKEKARGLGWTDDIELKPISGEREPEDVC